MKTKKFTMLHVAIVALLFSGLTFLLISISKSSESQTSSEPVSYSCKYNVKRLDGFAFIKPLVFVDEDCQSEEFDGVRRQLAAVADRYAKSGDVSTVSLYMRANNQWIGVNEDQKYVPGSLLKVPLLIAVLKIGEDHPGFLNKQIKYENAFPAIRFVNFPASKTIKPGNSYSVAQLLEYAIKYSDNNASNLLEMSIDLKEFQKVFTAVGLDAPNIYAPNTTLNPKEYSLFMRAIYNAGYLSTKDSEYAAKLLSECQFNEGLTQGLPAGTKIIHKFGESGNDGEIQLHESAIIYLKHSSFLLTVMSKGKDYKKLSALLGELSRTAYEEMSNLETSS
ncbi:MAG: serine hydrolase [Flavobacterium sp.]|nr:MAG: serine hydrolase [Flavobacterium sp.]